MGTDTPRSCPSLSMRQQGPAQHVCACSIVGNTIAVSVGAQPGTRMAGSIKQHAASQQQPLCPTHLYILMLFLPHDTSWICSQGKNFST